MKDFPMSRRELHGDRLLRMLVRMLDKNISAFSVTVTVSGAVLSGIAISRDEWVKIWLASMRDPSAGGELLAESLSILIESSGIYVIDDDLPDVDSPSYLHLKNVQIVRSDYPEKMPLWRVRLSEVSAWSPVAISRG